MGGPTMMIMVLVVFLLLLEEGWEGWVFSVALRPSSAALHMLPHMLPPMSLPIPLVKAEDIHVSNATGRLSSHRHWDKHRQREGGTVYTVYTPTMRMRATTGRRRPVRRDGALPTCSDNDEHFRAFRVFKGVTMRTELMGAMEDMAERVSVA